MNRFPMLRAPPARPQIMTPAFLKVWTFPPMMKGFPMTLQKQINFLSRLIRLRRARYSLQDLPPPYALDTDVLEQILMTLKNIKKAPKA